MSITSAVLPLLGESGLRGWAARRKLLSELLIKDNEVLGDLIELQRELNKRKATQKYADELSEIVQEFLSNNWQKLEVNKALKKEI